MRRLVAVFVVVGILGVGVGAVLVADPPADGTVVTERNPFAPEWPKPLNETTASAYLVDYEQTRFSNDLKGSRDFTLKEDEEMRADCTVITLDRTAADGFRIRLRCEGGIADVKRDGGSSELSYTVTYRITETTREQLAIRGYPYASRDELRPRPTAVR